MSYQVQIREVPDVLVASVRRRVSMATVAKEIPEAFQELMQAVEPVGYGDGMPGAIYFGEVGPETEWDMDLFMPVRERFDPPEGMEVRILAGATVASTVHRGPYRECAPAYDALHAWIGAYGYQIAGPPRELYLNDPNEVGEEEARTEILFPIR